jgi:hypothetical protein
MGFQLAESDRAGFDRLGQEILRFRLRDVRAREPSQDPSGLLRPDSGDLLRGIVAGQDHRIGDSASVEKSAHDLGQLQRRYGRWLAGQAVAEFQAILSSTCTRVRAGFLDTRQVIYMRCVPRRSRSSSSLD